MLPTDGLLEPRDSLESRFAYALQHSQPGDPAVLEALVTQYGAECVRLARSLLEYSPGAAPDIPRVIGLAAQGLHDAAEQIDQFWGEASPRAWLFSYIVRAARRRDYKHFAETIDHLPAVLTALPELVEAHALDPTHRHQAANLAALPSEARYAAVFVYGFGLSPDLLPRLLGVPSRTAQKNLAIARRRLHTGLDAALPEASHPERQTQLQDWLDQNLAEQPQVEDDLRQHLQVCAGCREYAQALQTTEEKLKRWVTKRWPPASLWSPEQIQAMLKLARTIPAAAAPRSGVPSRLRAASWVALALVALVGVYWAFQSLTPSYQQVQSAQQTQRAAAPLQPTPTAGTPLPTPIQPPRPYPPTRLKVTSQSVPLSVQDQFLTDDWLVFSADSPFLVPNDTNTAFDVFVYDLNTNTLERASLNSAGEQANGASTAASISADGRYVVFLSSATNLSELARGCTNLSTGIYCNDVYLHDRLTGETRRITLNPDGTAPDGAHSNPVISADGRFVFFWSSATKLTSTPLEPCETLCMNLFVYELQTGAIEPIQVGRSVEISSMSGLQYDRPGLSADGRWIGFTVLADDALGQRLGLVNEYEVVVLDWAAGVALFPNQTGAGTPGNGPSLIADLSSDGRFVAFTSYADDLVPTDNNGLSDVFVRDLTSGETWRASQTSAGESLDSSSGIYLDANYLQFVSLSADGQKVAFISEVRASSLTNPAEACLTLVPGSVVSEKVDECFSILIHNHTTGVTERFAAGEDPAFDILPELSPNGRWLAYARLTPGCASEQPVSICMELGVADLASGANTLLFQREQPAAALGAFLAQADPAQGLIFGNEPWFERQEIEQIDTSLTTLTIDANGRYLAAGGANGQVYLSAISANVFSNQAIPQGSGMVADLAFSDDIQLLAVANLVEGVRVFNVKPALKDWEHFSLADSDAAASKRFYSLAFSPDENLLAIGSNEGIELWQQRDEAFIAYFGAGFLPPGSIFDLSFSPDGSLLAAAAQTYDGQSSVWLVDPQERKLLLRLGGHDALINRVAFSPDGEYLVSASVDGAVLLWSVFPERNQFVYRSTLRVDGRVNALAFAPDSQTVILGEQAHGALIAWSLADNTFGEVYADEPGNFFQGLSYAGDGRQFFAVSSNGSILRWTAPERVAEPNFFERLPALAVGYQPEGLRTYADDPTTDPRDPLTWNNHFNQTYYSLESVVGYFDVQAPQTLPAGLTYMGIWLDETWGEPAVTWHRHTVDNQLTGVLLFYQGDTNHAFMNMQIPEPAVVERFMIGGVWAELLAGDWVDGGEAGWSWDRNAPVLRLRWVQNNTAYGVDYYATYATHFQPKQYLSLVMNFVAALADLDSSELLGEPPLARHVVRAGTSVSWLAEVFASSVPAIVAANQLTDNGDFIYVGQVLRIPMTNLSPLYVQQMEYDLDCDGQMEHLLRFTGGGLYTRNLLGLAIQELNYTGRYVTVQTFSVADYPTENFQFFEIETDAQCPIQLRLRPALFPLSWDIDSGAWVDWSNPYGLPTHDEMLNRSPIENYFILTWDGQRLNVSVP